MTQPVGPSATYPGYTFGTDIDTGMFHNSANQLGFAVQWGARYRDQYTKFSGIATGWAEYADGRRLVMLESLDSNGIIRTDWIGSHRLTAVQESAPPGNYQ